MDKKYDVIIAGGGVAGAFAAYKLSKYKNIKACVIEFGRPPGKRRRQLEGWLGCFPTGNSRLYFNDIEKTGKLIGIRHVEKAADNVLGILSDFGSVKPVKNKKPSDTVKKRMVELGYDVEYLLYSQWKPENVHCLSRYIAEEIENSGRVDFEFDNEIKSIQHDGSCFILETENGTFMSDKLILSIGRSGWRLTKRVYTEFGLIEDDDFATFGFMAEVPAGGLKDWNSCHCSLSKDNMIIGPVSWSGTVIPEDHVDLVISSWRSNEDRWSSEKAAFSVRMKQKFPSLGTFQTERLGKLAFILSDNRVGRIKVSDYLSGGNDLSLIPEYQWFETQMREVGKLFPNFITKGYINIPDISLTIPNIKIKKNLSVVKLPNLYVAGESAGINGLISACLTGYIAGENVCK